MGVAPLSLGEIVLEGENDGLDVARTILGA
jgi:hypothetical protein